MCVRVYMSVCVVDMRVYVCVCDVYNAFERMN